MPTQWSSGPLGAADVSTSHATSKAPTPLQVVVLLPSAGLDTAKKARGHTTAWSCRREHQVPHHQVPSP